MQIVDVICKVGDNFNTSKIFNKGTMKLFFDENEFKKTDNQSQDRKTVSGGSVANSIVGLSQLGNEVGLLKKYLTINLVINVKRIKKENVKYFNSKKRAITNRNMFNISNSRL